MLDDPNDPNQTPEPEPNPGGDPPPDPAAGDPPPPDPDGGPPLEWTPDLSYTVKDEKKEMDPGLAALIDSEEREKYFRELYTKADGLDVVKENLTKRAAELEELTEKHQTMDAEYGEFKKGLQRLGELRNNDFMAFQRHWDISDNAILKRAGEIIDLQDKGVDAQRAAEQAFMDRQASYQNERQLETVQASQERAAQELHNVKMQTALSAPDISAFRADFDKRMGKEGAFQSAVDEYGTVEYHRNQRYVDPQVAVAEVYRRYKALMPAETPPPPTQPGGTANPDDPPAPLPNLGQGRPGAPVRRRVKTMKDLIAIRDQLTQEAGGY